jgi:Bacteriophage Mu transposase
MHFRRHWGRAATVCTLGGCFRAVAENPVAIRVVYFAMRMHWVFVDAAPGWSQSSGLARVCRVGGTATHVTRTSEANATYATVNTQTGAS